MASFFSSLIPILMGLVMFGVLVLIHEFGHFIVARRCGVLVEEFAIGMGPKICGFKPGETLYSIRCIPIGGYCRMLGEDEDVIDERAFSSKKVSRRFAIVAAGATMNIILALVIYMGLILTNGYTEPIVSDVEAGSPAEAAGLMPGDIITGINGHNVHIFEDAKFYIAISGGNAMNVEFKRGGETFEESITPEVDQYGGYYIGFVPEVKDGIMADNSTDGNQKVGFFESAGVAFWEIIYFVKSTIYGLIQLVTFHLSLNDLMGPVGIVAMVGDAYQVTIQQSIGITVEVILQVTAMLSAAIGIFNLLPIPALDGGRLVFLVIEGIRKKPISPEKEGMVHFVGFIILMGLGLVVALNDFWRFFIK